MVRSLLTRWQTPVALFLVLLGFLVVTQLRTHQPLRQASALPSWRLPELAVLIRQQEAARRTLEAEVEELRQRARDYETALVEGRGLSEAMAREVAQYRLVLGVVPVEGPGVRVVLAEVAGARTGIVAPVVQAQDLSGLANELWSAGAEAMAINGARMLATTGIRGAGTGIVVGGTLTMPPYRIEAVGDPDALKAALAIRGGFVEGLRSVGLKVDVQTRKLVRLPPLADVEPFRYAKPRITQ